MAQDLLSISHARDIVKQKPGQWSLAQRHKVLERKKKKTITASRTSVAEAQSDLLQIAFLSIIEYKNITNKKIVE